MKKQGNYMNHGNWLRPRGAAQSAVFILLLFTTSLVAQTQKFATRFALDATNIPAALMQTVEAKPWIHAERGPVNGLREFAREKSGAVWLGSANGAARFDPKAKHRWDRWQYFWGNRWLTDNDVRNIVVEQRDGTRKVWIRTQTGVSLIEWRPMTLSQKAELFQQRIDARHVRHGMVSDSGLRVEGDLTTSFTHDNDNDGLWTAMYLGAECYRYAVTRDPGARTRA